MSATPQDFELHDYEAIAAVFDGLTLEQMRAAVGDGWQGFVEDNAPFEPETRSAPVAFGQWALEYVDVEASLDPDASPHRQGVVTIFIRLQPGARRGLLMLIAKAIREAFQNASAKLQFMPASTLRRKGIEDGFWTEQLDIHFFGE